MRNVTELGLLPEIECRVRSSRMSICAVLRSGVPGAASFCGSKRRGEPGSEWLCHRCREDLGHKGSLPVGPA